MLLISVTVAQGYWCRNAQMKKVSLKPAVTASITTSAQQNKDGKVMGTVCLCIF